MLNSSLGAAMGVYMAISARGLEGAISALGASAEPPTSTRYQVGHTKKSRQGLSDTALVAVWGDSPHKRHELYHNTPCAGGLLMAQHA